MTVNGYLFSAYLVIWTLIFVYLVYLHRKQKELARELTDLSRIVKEDETPGSH